MEVEDEVELADIPKIFIEDFNKCMDKFQDYELVVCFVHNGDKVQTCVSFIDNFVVLVIDEIAHFGFSGDNQLVHLNKAQGTSLRKRCFYCWVKLDEYHLVRRDLPCLLMRKKQWIILI